MERPAVNTKTISFFLYFIFFTATVVIFTSCSPGYSKYVSRYKAAPLNSVPDYSNLFYWASHPFKTDPADSISSALKKEVTDTIADVFFIHPTTYTQKEFPDGKNNADIENAKLNAKTDYTSILYQASVFNASARIFAPRYRQAHLSAFYKMKKEDAQKAFDLAFEDIKTAFEYYLSHYNNGRPIIIASHSQGTLHAGRLLKELFENKPLQKQLVCAYLTGLPVPQTYFSELQPCKDSSSTGCFVSWRTFKKGYQPAYVKKETSPAYVTNPLSWTMDTTKVDKYFNLGSILWKYNKLIYHTNGAQIHQNVLWIPKPKFPFSFLLNIRNFHAGDINLFYMNIRQNIKTRIAAYKQQAIQ